MIDHVNGAECRRVMAVLTNVSGLNVCGVFASCIRAVMAGNAITGNVRMVKVGWQPGDRRVAIVTVVAACNVCRVLASGEYAVVAGPASSKNLRMVYGERRRPQVCRMAVFANVCCLSVIGCLARRLYAVVAVHAVAGNVDVIEIGREPGNR